MLDNLVFYQPKSLFRRAPFGRVEGDFTAGNELEVAGLLESCTNRKFGRHYSAGEKKGQKGRIFGEGRRGLEVATVDTNATVVKYLPSNIWYTVTLSHDFQQAPVVLSQVQSDDDPYFVKTRQQEVTLTDGLYQFQVTMEQDDVKNSAHGTETIGWLALSPGQIPWNDKAMEVGRTPYTVTDAWYTIFFGPPFEGAPRFLGALASYLGTDGATMRYDEDSLTADSVQVHVQEDTTVDPELDHVGESVSYLAIEGSGTLSATMATDWLEESSGPGQQTTIVTGTIIRRSTYDLAGQPVALRVKTLVGGTVTESDLYHLHLDHLGSVVLLSDYADGGVVSGSLSLHEPFGDYRLSPSSPLTDRGFTGHRGNPDIGLIYMNARFYVPYINRFLSPDTIVPDSTDPQSFNRYGYALNNPVKYVDPSGHCVFAPPFDTIFCIALLALALSGDSVQPPINPPINASGGECFSALPDCFGDVVFLKDFSGHNEDNPIAIEEFEEFADRVAEDLYEHNPGWPGVSTGRGTYDTPFYNGGESERRSGIQGSEEGLWPSDQQVCIETIGCSGRSEINYIAQGMWGAATGEPLPISEAIVRLWKGWEYQEIPSEDVLFWLKYGHEYYQQWNEQQEG